jgi:hypothetical protein
MPAKGNSFWIFAFGYVIFALGLVGMGLDFYSRSAWSYPLNMGIVIGNSALCLLGLTAQVIAQSVSKLEKRLDRLAPRQPAS